jgi:hypothetical protein
MSGLHMAVIPRAEKLFCRRRRRRADKFPFDESATAPLFQRLSICLSAFWVFLEALCVFAPLHVIIWKILFAIRANSKQHARVMKFHSEIYALSRALFALIGAALRIH